MNTYYIIKTRNGVGVLSSGWIEEYDQIVPEMEILGTFYIYGWESWGEFDFRSTLDDTIDE